MTHVKRLDLKLFVVGERINPAGKPRLRNAIRNRKPAFLQQEALAQERAGAQALDLNVFISGLNRLEAMRFVAGSIRSVVHLPLVMDDRDPEVVREGLVQAKEGGFINSPVDVEARDEEIFKLAKQFRAGLFLLPMTHHQIPRDSAEHLRASRLLLERLEDCGIPREQVAFDAIVLALKQAKAKVVETLERIKRLKSELGVRTVIGLSNVSYRLRNRSKLNARFLKLAKACGLDVVICDPLQEEVMAVAQAEMETPGRFDKREFLEFAETCWA